MATKTPTTENTTYSKTVNGTITSKLVPTQVKDGKICADESQKDGVER